MEHLRKLIQHELGEVRCAIPYSDGGFEKLWVLLLEHSILRLNPGNVSLAHHEAEDCFKTLSGGREVQGRVVLRRIAGKSGQNCGLRYVQLLRGCAAWRILQAEVDVGSGIDAVGLVSVINAVQVHFQDIIFGIHGVELWGQNDLFELTDIGRFVSDNQVLNQLLGNGAATFDNAPILQVGDSGANYARQVDARIIPEVLIFRGDGCVN